MFLSSWCDLRSKQSFHFSWTLVSPPSPSARSSNWVSFWWNMKNRVQTQSKQTLCTISGLCCLGEAPRSVSVVSNWMRKSSFALLLLQCCRTSPSLSSDVSGFSWGGPALAPLKRTLSDTLGALATTGAPSRPSSTWQTHTWTHTEHFSWADREMNVKILLSEVVRVFFSYNKGRDLTGKINLRCSDTESYF